MSDLLRSLLGMVIFLLVGGGLAFTGLGLLFSFGVGIQSLYTSGQHYRPFVVTRKLLALNLCEPLINMVFVLAMALYVVGAIRGSSPVSAALRTTAPMAVLLVPALGLWLKDRFYREQCLYILLFGLARWALNVVIFLAFYQGWAWIDLLLTPLASGLMWWSMRWGKQQLRGPLLRRGCRA